MNYEYLKELPDFTEYCDQRLDSKLPSMSEIRRRHILMQNLTGLDLPSSGDRLTDFRRRMINENQTNSTIASRPYFRSHIYQPDCSIDEVKDWRHHDQSIDRIIDENTGRPTRYYHRGIDNLDFLSNNFYKNPESTDLKLHKPRRGFAGSIVDRAM